MSYLPQISQRFGEKKESNTKIVVAIVFGVLILITLIAVGLYFAFSAPSPSDQSSTTSGSGQSSAAKTVNETDATANTAKNSDLTSSKILGKYDIGSKITLKADNNQYLSRCEGCKPEVGASAPTESVFSQWILGKGDNGKITLKAYNGKYLGRCRGCAPGATLEDSAFANSDNSSASYMQWTMIDAGNGKVALQADTGKYLARCSGCSPQGSIQEPAFIHATDYTSSPYAQWTVHVL